MSTRTKGEVLKTLTPFLIVDLTLSPVQLPKGLPHAASIVKDCCNNNVVNDSSRIDQPEHEFVKRIISEGTPIAHAVVAALTAVRRLQVLPQLYSAPTNNTEPEQYQEPDDLVTEAWPWVQSVIDWPSWQKLCHRVSKTMVLTFVTHPLVQYANQVVPHLNREELLLAFNILRPFLLELPDGKNKKKIQEIAHVGLIEAIQKNYSPLPIAILSTEDSTARPIRHSCLPNTVWEWNAQCGQLQLLTLYDLDANEEWTVSRIDGYTFEEHQRASYLQALVGTTKCDCVRCKNEHKMTLKTFPTNLRDVIRFGYAHFHHSRFDDALTYFRHAIQMDASLDHIWHAIGAVLLAQNKFLDAQRHWRDAVETHACLKDNAGIALQLKKQEAYGYLNENPNDRSQIQTVVLPEFVSYCDGKCFVTVDPVVSRDECIQVIEWAKLEGWTVSRHYAVPTVDVPVHSNRQLLAWFNKWMETTVRPLMSKQFHILPEHLYCHDAFVVRYEATKHTNFLPVHVDESTHSFVLALNDEFKGGGTHFYDYDTTIAPPIPGCLVTFRGDTLSHGGNAVISGTRFILAVFLYCDPPRSRKRVIPLPERGRETFSFGFQV